MRALSTVEAEILDVLLAVEFRGAAELRAQVPHVIGVESNCTCGCPSFTPIIDRSRAKPAGVESTMLPVSLLEIDRPEGIPREVIVFADPDGYLANLECVYIDEARDEWPDPRNSAVYRGTLGGGTIEIRLPDGVEFRPSVDGDVWRSTELQRGSFRAVTASGFVEEFERDGRLRHRRPV